VLVEAKEANNNNTKSLFGYDGSVPFGDRFHCKKSVLSVLKRAEKVLLYGTVVTKHALKALCQDMYSLLPLSLRTRLAAGG